MKTGITVTLIIVSVLLTISFSYAEDSHREKIISANLLLDYADSSGQNLTPEKKTRLLYSTDSDNISSERYSLSGERNKRVTEVHHEFDVSHNTSMDIYNLPPSFVNKITYDFSKDEINRSSSTSFLELPSSLGDVVMMGAAFLTNLAVHEVGHEIVAHYVGAEGSRVNFFQKEGGDFFLGTSSVEKIDKRSEVPYKMGGEFFADLTFEHALRDYRKSPNTYNKSLLVASGTDFLWYCFYAFYLSSGNPSYDPVGIVNESEISRDMLFSVVLAKTLLNAYRVYSGQDKVVPYFKIDRYSASVNVMIPFDFGG